MFAELMPLLRKRRLLLTIALVEGDTIRATVVPQKSSETEDSAITTPLLEEALSSMGIVLWPMVEFEDDENRTTYSTSIPQRAGVSICAYSNPHKR